MTGYNGPPLIARLTRPFQVFFEREASSSILLLLMTLTALVWANSPLRESYEHLIHTHMAVAVGSFHLELTFHEFVNDALMAIFGLKRVKSYRPNWCQHCGAEWYRELPSKKETHCPYCGQEIRGRAKA